MPPEPNKKIEELLKGYAQKRRAESGADFALHPANRKILQGEVARAFPQTKVKPSFLFALWPRLAFIGIFTALLAITVLVLNTSPKSKPVLELSKRSDHPSPPAPAQRQLADAEKAGWDRSTDNADFSRKDVPAASLAKQMDSPRGITVIDGSAAVDTIRGEGKISELGDRTSPVESRFDALSDKKENFFTRSTNTLTASTFETSSILSGAAAASPGSRPAPAPASVQLYADALAPVQRRFVQQDLRAKFRPNLLSPPQPKILQSFELAQNGNIIRLLDSDGSIYAGEILQATKNISAENDLKNNAGRSSEFAFRVAGTNQQLQQLVTFTGNFELTNANLMANEKLAEKTRDAFVSGEFKRPSGIAGTDGGSIQGKISIGGTNEFEIQAREIPK